MADILINYRRSDSAIAAHVMYEVLAESFPGQVFIDIDLIQVAADFPSVLREALRTCSVMVSLVGHHWLTESDESGRRIDNSNDWVRMEIESALSSKRTTVVPVLLDDAKMPSSTDLPRSIQKLSKLHAVSLSAKAYRAEVARLLAPEIGRILREAEERNKHASAVKHAGLIVGDRFKDDDTLPIMMVVPQGRFKRGSALKEKGSSGLERPVTRVTIASRIAVSVFPITAFEWNRACESGFGGFAQVEIEPHEAIDEFQYARAILRLSGERDSLGYLLDWSTFRERLYPAAGISWDGAQSYCEWASGRTGRRYRLLSEAEWEYCCRATTKAAYATGNEISYAQAHFNRRYKPKHVRTAVNRAHWPEDSPRPVSACFENAFGLFGMHGNVWEWVEDCFHPNYETAPDDHTAWIDEPRSETKVARGGCYASDFRRLRSAARGKADARPRDRDKFGFRVACEL